MKIKAFRTVSIRLKPGEASRAFDAMQLAAKNLKNMGLFLVKNVLSSYDKDYKIKPLSSLHTSQVEALAAANAAANACNKTRMAKNKAKDKELEALDKKLAAKKISKEAFSKEEQKLKHSNLFADFMGTDANPWAILDDGLLDKLMRTRKDQKGDISFEVLPAKASEQVRKQISAEFKSWTKALKSYRQNPEKFEALPKMPSYMGKNDRMPVKFFAGAIGSKHFPSIAGRKLHTSFEGPALPSAAFDAYAEFDLAKLSGSLERQADRPGSKLVELRIVPGRSGSQKIEGVFECPVELPDKSFLAKMLSAARKDGIKEDAHQDYFAKEIAKLSHKAMPKSAALDPGFNNIATIVFSTGREAIVASNARIEAKLSLFDSKIDTLKSKLALAAPPAIAALALRRQNGERLAKPDFLLLRQFEKALHNDPGLQKLMGERERWLFDALHKLSIDIVQALQAEKIELLVAGRNVGWKNGASLGSDGNRRLHATPHAMLLEMLRYKCLDAGILFLDQEESYTSKASFALSEPIEVYGKESKAAPTTNQTTQPEIKEPCPFLKIKHEGTPRLRQASFEPALPSPKAAIGVSRRAKGTRAAPKGAKASSKHQFRIPRHAVASLSGLGLGPAWGSLHADVNGAYNILRKAMPAFKAKRGLSPRFGLWWLSAKGLRPFKASTAQGC